jgi:DNA transformation protein and related proteins
MRVSPAVRKDLLERLNNLAPVSDRSMFGGVGLFCEGRFFGLIYDDLLYFKADEASLPDYLKAGMGPFAPFGPEKASKRHFQVPPGVVSDKRKLKAWLLKAVAAADKAAEKRAEKKSGKGAGKKRTAKKRTGVSDAPGEFPLHAKAARGLGAPRTGRR